MADFILVHNGVIFMDNQQPPDELKQFLIARNDDGASELVGNADKLPEAMLYVPITIDNRPMTIMWFAARFNMPKTLKQLLDRDIDPTHPSPDGSLPAHAAALFRWYEDQPNDEVISLLVEGSADFNVQDAQGSTAYDIFDELGVEIPVPSWYEGSPSELRYVDDFSKDHSPRE